MRAQGHFPIFLLLKRAPLGLSFLLRLFLRHRCTQLYVAQRYKLGPLPIGPTSFFRNLKIQFRNLSSIYSARLGKLTEKFLFRL